jgi:CRISPR-associated protein Cas1
MGWRVVYIDKGHYLNLYLDNVKVSNEQKDHEITIPLSDIHTLILDNYQIVLTLQLMNRLMDYNVNVVLCNLEHKPHTLLVPQQGNRQATRMLLKQLEWTTTAKEILHQKIVKFKINNQLKLLKYLKKDPKAISLLEKYVTEVKKGDESNREGLAAKVYFRALFGTDFRRFEDDVFNAGLNYGYAILRSQISKTVVAKGLNPALGIFHKGPENAFNLSDDIIEPFRPLIDFYIATRFLGVDLFGKEQKVALIEWTTSDVRYKDRRHTMFNVVSMFVDDIVRYFDTGDLEAVSEPIISYHEL